jgi:TRAP transporter TAXI family solute receptor
MLGALWLILKKRKEGVEMMKSKDVHSKIVGFIGVFVLVSFLLPGLTPAQQKQFRIGSASLGSSGYIHWEACAFLANKYAPALKASSLSTGGSTEDVILLSDKKIELAHGTGLEVVSAWEGKRPFTKKIPVWQVFSWTVWSMPMVALADSDLNTYYDLKGKSVSLIKKGSGTESMYSVVLEEYGILKDLKKNYLSFDESKNALIDGLIVSFPGNFPGGKPHPIMIDLASRKPYKALELDLEVMKRVNKRNKGIIVTTLPKSAYERFTQDVPSPGFVGIGLSSAAADDDSIYAFLKAVLDHVDELHKISKVSDFTTLKHATEYLMPDYPVHPGAVRYFKEKGVWDDRLIVGKR